MIAIRDTACLIIRSNRLISFAPGYARLRCLRTFVKVFHAPALQPSAVTGEALVSGNLSLVRLCLTGFILFTVLIDAFIYSNKLYV